MCVAAVVLPAGADVATTEPLLGSGAVARGTGVCSSTGGGSVREGVGVAMAGGAAGGWPVRVRGHGVAMVAVARSPKKSPAPDPSRSPEPS